VRKKNTIYRYNIEKIKVRKVLSFW